MKRNILYGLNKCLICYKKFKRNNGNVIPNRKKNISKILMVKILFQSIRIREKRGFLQKNKRKYN